jgi:hypothetical protein
MTAPSITDDQWLIVRRQEALERKTQREERQRARAEWLLQEEDRKRQPVPEPIWDQAERFATDGIDHGAVAYQRLLQRLVESEYR